jgi:hypothetical protein
MSLLRAFTDIDQARPVHRWIVGAALLVGFVLLGVLRALMPPMERAAGSFKAF